MGAPKNFLGLCLGHKHCDKESTDGERGHEECFKKSHTLNISQCPQKICDPCYRAYYQHVSLSAKGESLWECIANMYWRRSFPMGPGTVTPLTRIAPLFISPARAAPCSPGSRVSLGTPHLCARNLGGCLTMPPQKAGDFWSTPMIYAVWTGFPWTRSSPRGPCPRAIPIYGCSKMPAMLDMTVWFSFTTEGIYYE